MFRFAIERGTLISVAFLILCLFGVIALVSVPVQMTPNIDKPVISVVTRWPGATPMDIEQEILIEQEEYLQQVRNLDRLVAEASMGVARVDLEFAVGTNMEESLVLVNNALSQVSSYPENVDEPRLRTGSSTDDPFIFYSVRNTTDSAEHKHVTEMAGWLEDNLGNAMERIPGVSSVHVRGGTEQQVHIAVDPSRLAARQLSMQSVREAIRARNRDSSGGDIETGKRRYVIRTLGRFESLKDIERIILADRGGNPVRLSDVGEVRFGDSELTGWGYMNGERHVVVMPSREPGTNVIELRDRLEAELLRLNEEVLGPKGLVVERYADDVGYVVEAVAVVQKNLALGGILACAVLFMFLRSFYPTLLGALGVPICTIGAFIGLLLMGRSVNVISLAGVAFAIGMTLDNSIVVLENIYRLRNQGRPPVQASLEGVNDVWKAVLASTLTTVFVFLPVALVVGEAGQLYSDIAIAISAAILLSMLVAVTLVPSAAARLPFTTAKTDDGIGRAASAAAARVFSLLDWLLVGRRRPLLLVVGVLALALLAIIALTPKAEYLPEGEEPKIFAFMLPPPGLNLSEMERIGRELDVQMVAALNMRAGDVYGEGELPPLQYFIRFSSAERLMVIAEPRDRDRTHVEALKAALSKAFSAYPGMIAFANRGSIFSGNSGGTRAIELDVTGPDLGELYPIAMRAFDATREALAGAQVRPNPGLSLSQPAVEIRPDWERASELGFTPGQLGYMIWALTDGAYVDEFFLEDEKIDMYLFSSNGVVEKPEDIAALPVYSDNGAVVPLSSIAAVKETVSASKLRRVDGARTVTLTIIPPADIPLEAAVDIVNAQVIEKLRVDEGLPDDVVLRIGGASDKLNATRDALSGNFGIAILLSYLLMVAIFSHWGYPLLILLSLPLGISGGLAGLWFMNHVVGIRMPFDMITMLGMIVLIGTAVNNPILLVEQARKNFHGGGMAPARAVIESVSMRLRPIMMSMLTTIFGLAPVVFLAGAGTELYRGLGTIVMFGLFFSTLLNLTFMPAMLFLLFQWRGESVRAPVP